MKKYAVLLLLVLGLSTSAWGYSFTSPSITCWATTGGWTPSLNLLAHMSPTVGLVGPRLAMRPNLLCLPMYQATCTSVNAEGVNIFQGQISNQAGNCQSNINLQIYRNNTIISGDPSQGN